MRQCFIDIETASTVPLSAGVDNYSAAATVILMAWALDDGPVQHWSVGDAPPQDLMRAFSDVAAVRLVAHNAAFERQLLTRCPPAWLQPLAARGYVGEASRWVCTMAQALAHSLPAALDQLSQLFKLDAQDAKQANEGKKLIRVFCHNKDRRVALAHLIKGRPADWAAFIEYCKHDVAATRALHKAMPTWNYPDNEAEHHLWCLDQRANDRGIAIDLPLVHAALAVIATDKARLDQETREASDGRLARTTQRDAMLQHLLDMYGVALPDLQVRTVERRLADDNLPQGAKDLLLLRLDASKASTAKYNTLARSVGLGERLRNTLQYCGASRTGRWAGRTFQPQNLPRPSLQAPAVELGIEALKAGVADVLFPSVMQLASDCLRGCLIAGPDKKLVVSDLSNIEGRVLAWLAGEQWKLDAFAAFDRGAGDDLYKVAYSRSFNVPPASVTGDQRHIGKVQELALGYAGGVGAFEAFAKAYGLDLDAMATLSLPAAPAHLVGKSACLLDWLRGQGNKIAMPDRTWIACDVIKSAWRQAHPATVQLWADLKNAVTSVLAGHPRAIVVGKLRVAYRRNWLTIGLPSGRLMCYPGAKLKNGGIVYQGVDPLRKKWTTLKTYSGKLVENATQAVARDVLAHAIPKLDQMGYPLVLSVHDELITEPPDEAHYSEAELSATLSTPPPWAQGLPLAAKGYEAYRYKKD